jgi:dienelactone hydrolase
MKQNARNLCGIGYVVLALDLKLSRLRTPGKPQASANERTLAEMTAAVRWLRHRADVLPERVGVLGLSEGTSRALTLAAATPLQACVLCDGPLGTEPALFEGLRRTPVLCLVAGKDEQALKALPAFRRTLKGAGIIHRVRVYEGVQKDFMRPDSKDHAEHIADAAWVEIYEFLGRYVEDAPQNAGQGRPPG